MISAVVVKDPDQQEGIDNNSDIDDSFTCQTDLTTVRASNVRRVTFSPTMDEDREIADDVVQLIQGLFAGLDDHNRRRCLGWLKAVLQDPTIQPVNAVRGLNFLWGHDLSEDLLHQLEDAIAYRRDEFINALQRQGVMYAAQEASLSATSSLTNSRGDSNQ